MYRIAHNLIRWLMIQAVIKHDVDWERISFKGTIDSLREFSQAMAQARSGRKRQALWNKRLRTLAADLLPDRPGRGEPRAVKRQRNKYPPLTTPRDKFRDPPSARIAAKNLANVSSLLSKSHSPWENCIIGRC